MDSQFQAAPLISHLVELKKRLIYIIAFFFVAFGICYAFSEDIYVFLTQPLEQAMGEEQRRMIYTGLTEAFFTYMKLAFFAATFLSFPMIAAQVYYFLAPGLYKKERQFLLPFLFASPLLFIAGAAFVFYLIMPMAWHFLLGFESSGDGKGLPIVLEAKVSEYLSLVMHFMIGFGLAFQLPVVLIILAKLGIVHTDWLKRNRRYALVVIVILAAILTPPDVLSQIGLASVLYALYEISIIGCRFVTKQSHLPT